MYSTSDRIDDITTGNFWFYFYSTVLNFGLNTTFWRPEIVLFLHIYLELEVESSHDTGGGDWKIPESF